MQQNDSQSFLDHYQQVSPKIQRQKRALVMRIMALQKLDVRRYREAIDEYLSLYPDDGSGCMVTIYDFIERGWLTEAHANIDKLDRAIGGDPYLQLLHARAFIEAGELVRAKKILNEPFDSAAVNIKAHWLLVSASLKEKEFETTANLLSKLRDELGEELADLTQVPAYSEFVKSPQYLKWINGAVKR